MRKGQEITGLIEAKRLEPIPVRWELLVQDARIMDGSFCGVTAGECRSGPSRGIGGPTCLRDGCGFEVGFVTFHKTRSLPQIVRANAVVRGFPVREESKVALLESPYGLGATARISSSLTDVKQNIGRRNRALRGNETRTPDAETKTSGQAISMQSFPRSLQSRVFKLAIAMARSFYEHVTRVRSPEDLQQLIRIDIHGDDDVFRQRQFVQRLPHEPAQAHDRFAADQDVEAELAL